VLIGRRKETRKEEDLLEGYDSMKKKRRREKKGG
jgi:hypothetical protein